MKTPAKAPKRGSFMGIKGVQLSDVSYFFFQDSDTNQAADEGQTLKVFTEDSGAGAYLVIETPRWAMDADDIDKFCDALKRIASTPEEYGR